MNIVKKKGEKAFSKLFATSMLPKLAESVGEILEKVEGKSSKKQNRGIRAILSHRAGLEKKKKFTRNWNLSSKKKGERRCDSSKDENDSSAENSSGPHFMNSTPMMNVS